MGKPTAVDLFSGAGGLSQGLKQAGFRVVGAIELDKDASDVYRINHPACRLVCGDIQDVDPLDAGRVWRVLPGELDLLAGCPPCQGFSSIGTRNRAISHSDPRNELIFEMIRFVEQLSPKIIMVENVPALAKDNRLVLFRSRLEELGYCSDVKVLNVQKYNVPQRRKRMILLASRLGRISVRDVDLTEGRPKTVRDAFFSMKASGMKDDSLLDFPEKRSAKVMKIIHAIPHDGGSRKDLPADLVLDCHRKTSGFRDVYGRMSWDSPAPTITCGCTNPSKGRFLHPEEDRAITLREAAMLQTFPLNYSFPREKGKQKISRMIGNALPPAFIEFHARCAKAAIFDGLERTGEDRRCGQ